MHKLRDSAKGKWKIRARTNTMGKASPLLIGLGRRGILVLGCINVLSEMLPLAGVI